MEYHKEFTEIFREAYDNADQTIVEKWIETKIEEAYKRGYVDSALESKKIINARLEGNLVDKVSKRKYETCSECGKSDETVYSRNCGYANEMGGHRQETVCDACEHEHLMDI